MTTTETLYGEQLMTTNDDIARWLEGIDDADLSQEERVELAHRVAERAPLYPGYAHRLDPVQRHAQERGEATLAAELKIAAARLRARHGAQE